MMIKILFFAGIAEKVGQSEVKVDLSSQVQLNADQDGYTVNKLRHWLITMYPEIEPDLKKAMVAVNEEFAEENTRITETDSVAFIPPVSGG
jgi:molybdopterin converting factor subunit 1